MAPFTNRTIHENMWLIASNGVTLPDANRIWSGEIRESGAKRRMKGRRQGRIGWVETGSGLMWKARKPFENSRI
jgi:hypothetical protein